MNLVELILAKEVLKNQETRREEALVAFINSAEKPVDIDDIDELIGAAEEVDRAICDLGYLEGDISDLLRKIKRKQEEK